MKHRALTLTMILGTMAASAAGADTPPQTGMEPLRLTDDTTRPVDGFVWYPTDTTDSAILAHGNVVWQPIRVHPGAAPQAGAHPLVVLSHGMFGNARNQAWLAEALVAQGFVVAAIDHPGTSTFQRDADDRRQLWRRPEDISRTINAVLADPDIGATVDAGRIYMAGHSLGGFTAMLLAGARYDAAHLDGFCKERPDDRVCTIFGDWQIAATDTDRRAMEAELADPRIRAFAVFDLGGTQSFAPESLTALDRPMLVYGAPDGGDERMNIDIEARALATALPRPIVTYHEPGTLAHFDFLGICNEGALDVLRAEEPDDVFVCEKGREERMAEHAEIAQQVADFFAAH